MTGLNANWRHGFEVLVVCAEGCRVGFEDGFGAFALAVNTNSGPDPSWEGGIYHTDSLGVINFSDMMIYFLAIRITMAARHVEWCIARLLLPTPIWIPIQCLLGAIWRPSLILPCHGTVCAYSDGEAVG